ncbi:na+/H+ antiporter, NhaD family protein, partial [Chlamydia psittaci 84-8471/1]
KHFSHWISCWSCLYGYRES